MTRMLAAAALALVAFVTMPGSEVNDICIGYTAHTVVCLPA